MRSAGLTIASLNIRGVPLTGSLLARKMPSFRHVSYRATAAGPRGGLATFSRRPVSRTAYQGLGVPRRLPGIPGYVRLMAMATGHRRAGFTRCITPSWPR